MAFGGFLRQSTAVDILIGPFVEDGDGDTPVTGSTLDVELSKNGQALANKNDATAPVHDAAGTVDGYYNCELDATDTGTLGLLTIVCHHADSLPVRLDFQVVTANWWDSMCSTEKLDVNVAEVSDDSTAADDLELFVENSKGTDHKVLVSSDAQDLSASLDVNSKNIGGTLQTGNDIGADVNAILEDTATTIPGTITTAQNDLDILTGSDGATLATAQGNYAPSKAGDAMALTAGAVDDVWDEDVDASHQTAGSAGKKLDDAGGAADPWATSLPGAYGAGTAGKIIGDNIDAPISVVDTVVDSIEGKVDAIDTVVDAILVDSADLQAAWANGGRLDLILDAIALDTETTLDGKLTDIETDTQDIQSRLPDALVAGNIKSDVLAISGSTDAADNLEASAEVIEVAAAAAGTLSPTEMTTNLTEVTDDHYNGRIIIWASGVLLKQATDITDYNGTTKMLTFTAVTEAPSDGDTFIIL